MASACVQTEQIQSCDAAVGTDNAKLAEAATLTEAVLQTETGTDAMSICESVYAESVASSVVCPSQNVQQIARNPGCTDFCDPDCMACIDTTSPNTQRQLTRTVKVSTYETECEPIRDIPR